MRLARSAIHKMEDLRYIPNKYPDYQTGIKTFNESSFMKKLSEEHAKGK